MQSVARMQNFFLGRQGEAGVRPLMVDCSAWLEQVDDLEISVMAIRPGESVPYAPAEVDVEDGILTWTPDATDTARAGMGTMLIRGSDDGGHVIKSATAHYRVETAFDEGGSYEPPEPVPAWLMAAKMAVSIKETVSGNAVNFADGADGVNMPQVLAQIVARQPGSGAASPSNVRPIGGYSGCHVWQLDVPVYDWVVLPDTDTTVGGVAVKVEKGCRIRLSGTASDDGSITLQLVRKIEMANNDWARYHFMGEATGGISVTISSFTKDLATGDLNIISVGGTDTTSIQINIANGTTYDVDGLLFALKHGDEVPAVAKLHEVSWSSAAGVVYGGSIDLATGVMVVDHIRVAITEDNVDAGNLQTGANGNRCGFDITTKLGVKLASSTTNVICNIGMAAGAVNVNTSGNWQPYTCAIYRGTGASTWFRYIFPTDITSNTAARKWLSDRGCEIVCPLDTPLVYKIMPREIRSLLGANAMGADCGALTVTYCADTKLYVDNAVAGA